VRDDAFRFMSVKRMDLAFAPAIVARLSVTGELGYEIYVPTAYLPSLLDAAIEASTGLAAQHIGFYALNSLRLEKSFGIWSREYSRDYTPHMARLQSFIDYERADFIGRAAALRDRDTKPMRHLVTLAIDSADADASGYEPLYSGQELVGFVTSGGYGHTVEQSLAMGYIDYSVAADEADLFVVILGERRACRILGTPAVDPTGSRMRS
jgi:dimethylglycine dehydrogenase